ncbi:MAG: aromatic-ring-hydroxylating dioxygenase subunit beta [Pigmentiphaga sp.]|uniref:aromatic-ring-hydroxylating dioxygenase subunit beta n=1 Tax=Pigmentiphaga sp. TaxID=1977564 RepID=UPI0029B49EBC|nr:aromatic-ring-hydroxylating dioxygenase subunit beta [Pigmentiphaga sp.]MDX3906131.1 aromatic-ring-hydroxylating dioxygenase subunit beta [Pigmentiphaga sp.]
MSADTDLYVQVSTLLAKEALYLDEKNWDAWLDLFAPDVEYFVPAWVSEDAVTTDPRTQLCLMYMDSRLGLEERIFRIRSRDSFASLPLDRTSHQTTNIVITAQAGDEVQASASWLVHCVGPRGDATRGGRYYYTLRRLDGQWKIARKHIVMIDEKIEGTIDVYHI